ncbi:MAG TPA: discoidin domain-containing protein [Chthoniobacteraceae bacterium]|nr:discoidin domain-containing protein [Chthoniobacteraceae bacterium]
MFVFLSRLLVIIAVLASAQRGAFGNDPITTASSTASGSRAAGAFDRDRFSISHSAAWIGGQGEASWWWQIEFQEPRQIGAILQIVGDHAFIFRHSPQRYVWQASDDGGTWRDLEETAQTHESRCYRIIRLKEAHEVRALRLRIDAAEGGMPVLREIEFFPETQTRVEFPDWIVAVNTTDDRRLPNHGQDFIPLAQSCDGWAALQPQQVWLGEFDAAFVSAEPRPLCAFLSGNFKDWCEVDRETWRGTAEVLKACILPMWASCGGAQGLAILAETGVDKPWDCPHCRDPRAPKLPIYTHIGHTGVRPCGDYSACVHERGPHEVVKVGEDVVFRGLPASFQVMESHCGQIEWAPAGWSLIATAGEGTLTKTQCLRRDGFPIYAAQFHIEMAGTPENSRRITSNLLALAKEWRTQQRVVP